MPIVQEKSASEILKFNQDLYGSFQQIQKCAFNLKCDLYIYGNIIHELLSHQRLYNPLNSISAIFVCNKQKDELAETTEIHFDSSRPLFEDDKVFSFRFENKIFQFYFLPEFDPFKINDEYGFTIDQLYFDIKNNKLIDTTGVGMSHFSSIPMIIKSTVPVEKWNAPLLFAFLVKVGTYYDSQIENEDFENLKNIKIETLDNIGTLFCLNRPGTALLTLFNLFPQSLFWVFNSILKLTSIYHVSISENIWPTKVLSEEKLKLLDLYTDYYNSSGSPKEKSEQSKNLVKLLLSL